jgi:hypothetical protein
VRPNLVLGLALALTLAGVSSVAVADPVPPTACTPPGTLACPVYTHYENRRYGFSVEVPAFFTRKPGDADGRGQPFDYAGKARIRAWAMVDNPPMTVDQLYGDWARRDGVTFKSLVANTWVVRGKADGGRQFYSRSILADGIITTVEVTYAPELADAMEPILAHLGASLMINPGVGARAHAH